MIYIDRVQARGGSGKFRKSAHLFTDEEDLEKLHAFAKFIGLRKAWFQDEKFPHYDLTGGMWIKAYKNGASVVPEQFLAALLAAKRQERT